MAAVCSRCEWSYLIFIWRYNSERALNTTNFTSVSANTTNFLTTPFFNPYYIKIRFRSSGAVLSLTTIQRLNPMPGIFEYYVTTLNYGGQHTNTAGAFDILNNNTLLLAQLETPTSWSLLVNELPRFVGNRDHGYRNFQVNSSYPEINSTVPSNISSISISYFDQVVLSEGNISIYQIIDSDNHF
ncbi:hypothetical protein C2G38_562701 [Gigaspora rosea]|uniref:Uncharacterized protein n=1 Tax=Gigaspora rosea TaxID=44941 RepID=A0A397U6M2_9GLOM|nr:hypothetical protein C2G38_562701 [Gigaspora rosea]